MGVGKFLSTILSGIMDGIGEFNSDVNYEKGCSRCKHMASESKGYYCLKNANADKYNCASNYIGCTVEEVQKCACIYNDSGSNFEDLGYHQNVYDKLPVGCVRCQNFNVKSGKVFECIKGYDMMNSSDYELKNFCKCDRAYFDSAEYEKDIDNCY